MNSYIQSIHVIFFHYPEDNIKNMFARNKAFGIGC